MQQQQPADPAKDANPKENAAPRKRGVSTGASVALKALDTSGTVHGIGYVGSAAATVLVFLGVDCPVSNEAVAEMNRLGDLFGPKEVLVYGVLSDPALSRASAREYAQKHECRFPVLVDTTRDIVLAFEPTITPEACVLDRDGKLAYRGALDDTFEAPGKRRKLVEHRFVEAALEALLAGGKVEPAETTPVGCVFESWDRSAPAAVTYAREVADVLRLHCVACHHTAGPAPFSLVGYEVAAKRAKMLASVTDTGFMPPWPLERGFGHFRDEPQLTDRDKAILAAWAKAGAPRGDPTDEPPPPPVEEEWALGKPDFVIQLPKDYVVPATGPDKWMNFVIPSPFQEDVSIVAVEGGHTSGNGVVHHVHLFLDGAGKAKELEAAAGGFGFEGTMDKEATADMGTWGLGIRPSVYPPGSGMFVPKGTDFVLQVHYHPKGTSVVDRTRIGIHVAKKPAQKVVKLFGFLTFDLAIPPNEAHYTRAFDRTFERPVTLLGIYPHMHLLGKSMKATATLPDGTEIPLVNLTDWDIRWETLYKLPRPLRVPAGTKLHIDAVYDNSTGNINNPFSPPQLVKGGIYLTNEMCMCFVEAMADSLEDAVFLDESLRKQAGFKRTRPAPTH